MAKRYEWMREISLLALVGAFFPLILNLMAASTSWLYEALPGNVWLTTLLCLLALGSVIFAILFKSNFSSRTFTSGCSGCLIIPVSLLGIAAVALAASRLSLMVVRYDFASSTILVLLLLAGSLSPKNLAKQTWRKLSDNWLKWSGVSAVAVGGFGFIGIDEGRKLDLLKIALSRSQVGIDALTLVYLTSIALLGGAYIFRMVGSSAADSQDSYQPTIWFAPAFVCAWLGNLGSFTLFFNSLILTFVAHVNA